MDVTKTRPERNLDDPAVWLSVAEVMAITGFAHDRAQEIMRATGRAFRIRPNGSLRVTRADIDSYRLRRMVGAA